MTEGAYRFVRIRHGTTEYENGMDMPRLFGVIEQEQSDGSFHEIGDFVVSLAIRDRKRVIRLEGRVD